jgi:hypothetical protein
MSSGVQYFYASGMRIPIDRAFVELSDKSMRRIVVDRAASSHADVITLEELVNSDIDTVLVTAPDGMFSLPLDPTRARGRQRVAASTTWLHNIYRSLPLSKRSALAAMQLEMMPRVQRTLSWESHNRLIAALPHLSQGELATVIKSNDGALAYVNGTVLGMMIEHDVASAHELARWAAENPNGAPHVDSFATMVVASPLIDEALRQEISTAYVARMHLRLPQRLTELEVLAASARAGIPGVATVLKRALRPIFEHGDIHAPLRARFDLRCLSTEVLDAMCQDIDASHAAMLLTHIGDLVSASGFDLLVAANPTAALEVHPLRVTREALEAVDAPALVVANNRSDLLSQQHREWLLQNPDTMPSSFAVSLTDAELASISQTSDQLNVLVRNFASAPVLVNRLSDEDRETALVFIVEALEDYTEIEDAPAFFSTVTTREQLRLVEDALSTVPARRRARLLDALAETDRFSLLRVASALSVRQMATALDDASLRLAKNPADQPVRSALQSFIARRTSLLKRTEPSLRAAIELGIADAEDILAGLVDEIVLDPSSLDTGFSATHHFDAPRVSDQLGADIESADNELLAILAGSSARVTQQVTHAVEEGHVEEFFQNVTPFRQAPSEATPRPSVLEELSFETIDLDQDIAPELHHIAAPGLVVNTTEPTSQPDLALAASSVMMLSDADVERIAVRMTALAANEETAPRITEEESQLLAESIAEPQGAPRDASETLIEVAPVVTVAPRTQVFRTAITEGSGSLPVAFRLQDAPDQQVVKLEVEVALTPSTADQINEIATLLPQLKHFLESMSSTPGSGVPSTVSVASPTVTPAVSDELPATRGVQAFDEDQPAAPTDGRYVSSAHKKAALELSRLRDEAAVFSVMMTSTSIGREARWARKKLSNTTKKLKHIENVMESFPS